MTIAKRLIEKQIRLRIPQQYHQEPVISNLVSKYQVTVNISAAILGANAKGDGWFHLVLSGQSEQVKDALGYLNDLNLEILNQSETDGW